MENTQPTPGCYVDSHWGQYAMARSIQVAIEQGWDDKEAEDLAARHLAAMGPSTEPGLDEDEFERLVGATDNAQDWLNDQPRPDNHYWGWNEGDFGLYPLEEEEE